MNWKDVDLRPSDRKSRQFAAIWFVVSGLLALQLYLAGKPSAIYVAIVALAGLAGVLLPAIARPMFVAATVVTFPIGWLVSRVLLAIVFYGVFTPLAVLFRIVKRDALNRQPLDSYWSAKKTTTDKARYLRQF